MTVKRKRGFTLVELLVVIAIIVILMSILLPALKYAKSMVGVGTCAKQIRNMNDAFHSYINEWDERLPWTSSRGNLSASNMMDRMGPGCPFNDRRATGLGVLYGVQLLNEPSLFYCPAYTITSGSADQRRARIAGFEEAWEKREWIKCDYVVGYWVMPGCGPWPVQIGPPNDKVEQLKRVRVAWLADGYPSPVSYQVQHDNWKYMNVGMLDGSVRAIVDYRDKLPRKGAYGYYWPYNYRPMWGWWEYFGTGKKL